MHLHNKKLISAFVALTLTTASSAVFATKIAERELAAQQASAQLIKQLGGALKKEMASHGPESAISICRDLAPKISGEISRTNGWQVTRVSQKARNPLLGIPDAWEHKVLADFEARKKKGEKYSEMTFSETVEESGIRYYRFMKAIGTKPVCLTCHGNPDKMPEGLKAKLNADYPMDQALGYQMGELRGAVSIKQSMATPLPQ